MLIQHLIYYLAILVASFFIHWNTSDHYVLFYLFTSVQDSSPVSFPFRLHSVYSFFSFFPPSFLSSFLSFFPFSISFFHLSFSLHLFLLSFPHSFYAPLFFPHSAVNRSNYFGVYFRSVDCCLGQGCQTEVMHAAIPLPWQTILINHCSWAWAQDLF